MFYKIEKGLYHMSKYLGVCAAVKFWLFRISHGLSAESRDADSLLDPADKLRDIDGSLFKHIMGITVEPKFYGDNDPFLSPL